jgi:hypothetical protein
MHGGIMKRLSGKLTPAEVATVGIRKGWENALENLSILIRRQRLAGDVLTAEDALQSLKLMTPHKDESI